MINIFVKKNLRYTHFPPKVQEVLATWDDDNSGSVSVSELMVAAKAQERMNQENALVKRMLFGAVVVR
jgi:Ca2+-binding EF-hand superfamily protein